MKVFLFYIFSFFFLLSFSQDFNRKDSLRGELTSLRSCYDVTFYDLFIVIDDKKKKIQESYNEISFVAVQDFSELQIDLFSNMDILYIDFDGDSLHYTREFDAVFVHFPNIVKEGESAKIKVWYSGYPRKAVNPPWDGGFSWEKDKNMNPWIGVSCQGLGASAWWPCKDHQSDEPDSMKITINCRRDLKAISNGNLIHEDIVFNKDMQDSLIQAEWFVSYPINNYAMSINIGDYVHFSDFYLSGIDTLDLSYYVLSYNRDKAEDHFTQVKPMMRCFENYFGPYPFWNDGFALVETPYLGMEHQSGIAYGNNYLSGYYGNTRYISGLDFDFIIIHEAGHEWWGNSITTNDIADMWIHEGFCTYAEVLYVECMYGYNTMISYVNGQKNGIRNDKPVVGPYHVNCKGSSDMYSKSSVMLHTLRTIVDDDELWLSLIRGIYDQYKYQTVDAIEIIKYIEDFLDKDLTYFFDQYLHSKQIPELQYKLVREGRNITLMHRWNAIPSFKMPILVNSGGEDFWIYPSLKWKEMNLGRIDLKEFNVLEELFLVNIKKVQ